jgi:hypothetical protein
MEPNPEESFPNGKDPCTLTKPDTMGILVGNGFARDSKLKGKSLGSFHASDLLHSEYPFH